MIHVLRSKIICFQYAPVDEALPSDVMSCANNVYRRKSHLLLYYKVVLFLAKYSNKVSSVYYQASSCY